MRMRSFRFVLLGLFVLALAGLSIAEEETPGVTADTIKLGSFIAQSGPVAPIGIPVVHGAQTWYNFINDQWGGIYGRKIEFIALDDGFNPANTVAAVKKLVEEEKVFAIVNPLGTITYQAVFDYLKEQGVPVVSPHGNAVFMCQPTVKTAFSIQPNNIAFGRTLAQYATIRLGAKKIGVAYVQDAFGTELYQYVSDELQKRGITPVATVSYPGTETSFSSYVLQLQQAGAEAVILLGYLADAAAILREADTLGYKPKWLGTNTITPVLYQLAGAAAEGLIAEGFATDPNTPYHPEAYLFTMLLNRYFPGEVPSGYSEIAYIGAQMVTDALVQAGPDLTREKFIQALESFKDWEHGLTPPITFSPEDHCGIEALWLFQLRGGGAAFLEEWDWTQH